MHRGNPAVHLPKLTPNYKVANQLSPSPADLLIDLAGDHLTYLNSHSRSLDSSHTESGDNSLDTLLPEIPIEMDPV